MKMNCLKFFKIGAEPIQVYWLGKVSYELWPGELIMVACSFNLSSWEAEAGENLYEAEASQDYIVRPSSRKVGVGVENKCQK